MFQKSPVMIDALFTTIRTDYGPTPNPLIPTISSQQ